MSTLSLICLALVFFFIFHAIYQYGQARKLIREHGHSHLRNENLKVQKFNIFIQCALFLFILIINLI